MEEALKLNMTRVQKRSLTLCELKLWLLHYNLGIFRALETRRRAAVVDVIVFACVFAFRLLRAVYTLRRQ